MSCTPHMVLRPTTFKLSLCGFQYYFGLISHFYDFIPPVWNGNMLYAACLGPRNLIGVIMERTKYIYMDISTERGIRWTSANSDGVASTT